MFAAAADTCVTVAMRRAAERQRGRQRPEFGNPPNVDTMRRVQRDIYAVSIVTAKACQNGIDHSEAFGPALPVGEW